MSNLSNVISILSYTVSVMLILLAIFKGNLKTEERMGYVCLALIPVMFTLVDVFAKYLI